MQALIKTVLSATLVSTGLLSAAIAAADPRRDDGYHYTSRWQREPVEQADYAYARVVEVAPIVRRVAVESPRRECWVEEQTETQPRSATPSILGAIVGGVIGHQFGSGGSRDAATMAGAVLGASVGHDAAAKDSVTISRDVQRCSVRTQRDVEERIDGYRVTYVYRGREYTTVMDYDPGNRVQVRVGMDVDVVR